MLNDLIALFRLLSRPWNKVLLMRPSQIFEKK